MFVEKRKRGNSALYYLAHAYRKAGKALKLRVFLGENLSPSEISEKRPSAERTLLQRMEASAGITDPFETVLSPSELAELKTLEAGIAEIKISHLSEDDWRKFTEAFAYDTNAIEGSTILPFEVKNILERGIWPDKPKNDISETYGVEKAIEFIRKTKEHLSIPLILEMHRLVFQNSKPFAGKLRKPGIEVVITDGAGGVVHRGAPSTHVRKLLKELEAWYFGNKKLYSPIVLAAVVHNQFENIHPFQDGNGRVGRLLLNNVLLKHGLPPLNIELKNRSAYYASLQAYEHKHDLRPTIELMLKEYRALSRLLKKGKRKQSQR